MYRDFPMWYRDVPEWQLQDWRAVGWPAALRLLESKACLSEIDFTVRGRKGLQLILTCCFHEERTPSLYLYSNGGYICFGCRQAGSISDFVMILMDFPELHDLHAFFDDAFRLSYHIDGQLSLPLADTRAVR